VNLTMSLWSSPLHLFQRSNAQIGQALPYMAGGPEGGNGPEGRDSAGLMTLGALDVLLVADL
jgi:hypothetical protein